MRKAAGLGTGIFISLLIVGGLFYYSYNQLSVNLTDVSFHSIEWTTITWSKLVNVGLNTLSGNWFGAAFELIDGINLNLYFDMTNNGLLPVYIPDVTYDILINDVSIGEGKTFVDVTINPGQTEQITSFQNLQKNSIEPAVLSIIESEGIMDITIQGDAHFQLLGVWIPVPFEATKQISVYDEIENKINEEIQKNQQLLQDQPGESSLGKQIIDTLDQIADKIFDSLFSDCSGDARCFSGTVTRIIDGDTIEVNGKSIRFALASAPEWNEPGGEQATYFIETICPVGSTALVDEDDGQTQGSYGRIVAVVYCNDYNLNEELLDSGLGELSFSFCDSSEFWSTPWAFKHGCFEKMPHEAPEPEKIEDCDPAYPDFCIPSPPPDLNCKDISQKRFTVLPPDPHRFDWDKDGIGCES